jgi:hypothetical protein
MPPSVYETFPKKIFQYPGGRLLHIRGAEEEEYGLAG